ncbi:Ig-like domain-containing protein [Gemmatimonas sp.]
MSVVALPRRTVAALRVVRAAMLCWTIAACGGGGIDSAGGITTPPAIQVGTVTVSLPSTPLEVGATTSASAEVRSTAGAVLGGRTITWSSSAQGVATVSDAGVITGVGVGTATISATSEGKTGTATVTVIQPPVASVVVSIPQTSRGTIKKCGNERQTVAPSRVSQSPPGESRHRKGATARVEDRHPRGHVKPDVADPRSVHS